MVLVSLGPGGELGFSLARRERLTLSSGRATPSDAGQASTRNGLSDWSAFVQNPSQ